MSESFNLSFSLDEIKVKQICSMFLEKFEIIKIKPMIEGLSAYMLKVTVKKPEYFHFVIRIIDQRNKRGFEHQIGNILFVKKKKLFPVPNILFKDNSGEIIPESYYCYEYIEGETLDNVIDALNFEQKKKLYSELGAIVGKMHAEVYPGSEGIGGNLFLENEEIIFEEWKYKKRKFSSTYYSLAESYKEAVKHGFKKNFKQYYPSCKKLWNKYKKYLKYEESLLGYSHLDLNGDNVIIKEEKVQAFIDLEMICFVNRHFDLARCEKKLLGNFVVIDKDERKKLIQVFRDSYEKYIPIEETYWNKRPAFFLIELMDDLEWLPDYEKRLKREKISRIKQNLIEELEELISTYS
ncbi:MAG: phosphotransferase [Asgard group archaeon]|nr:phosphotransferase [Asgard group archaeon]